MLTGVKQYNLVFDKSAGITDCVRQLSRVLIRKAVSFTKLKIMITIHVNAISAAMAVKKRSWDGIYLINKHFVKP